ncbi:hypothetical protein LPC08_16405 [Roseomonas sp. OT10]|uniref:hypothetical protein n=1 Tax=Roseomonas cutis TaxID=2897332 RepID=UPI001E323C2A|nr:hypothetical protein [Roseomonas sp. OT10]UFN47590.1 hypothetical protein LPC08_16405 [Roseomonas sp. OT10]
MRHGRALLLASLALLCLGGCVQVTVPDPYAPGPYGMGQAAAAGALLGGMMGAALEGAARPLPPIYPPPPPGGTGPLKE